MANFHDPTRVELADILILLDKIRRKKEKHERDWYRVGAYETIQEIRDTIVADYEVAQAEHEHMQLQGICKPVQYTPQHAWYSDRGSLETIEETRRQVAHTHESKAETDIRLEERAQLLDIVRRARERLFTNMMNAHGPGAQAAQHISSYAHGLWDMERDIMALVEELWDASAQAKGNV